MGIATAIIQLVAVSIQLGMGIAVNGLALANTGSAVLGNLIG